MEITDVILNVQESIKAIDDFHLLDTGDLTPILISAMQEQQEQIILLQEKIKELEARL